MTAFATRCHHGQVEWDAGAPTLGQQTPHFIFQDFPPPYPSIGPGNGGRTASRKTAAGTRRTVKALTVVTGLTEKQILDKGVKQVAEHVREAVRSL
jgi:hypothetical protein